MKNGNTKTGQKLQQKADDAKDDALVHALIKLDISAVPADEAKKKMLAIVEKYTR